MGILRRGAEQLLRGKGVLDARFVLENVGARAREAAWESAACSTSRTYQTAAPFATFHSRGAPELALVKKWLELPPALTAIVGKGHTGAFTKGFKHLDMVKGANVKAYSQCLAGHSKKAVNRAYINILSSFSCAPKAQAVVRGLPLLMTLGPQQVSCYAVDHSRMHEAARGGTEPVGLMPYLEAVSGKLSILFRALVLSILFSPLVLTAPFTLHFGVGRELWARLLRVTLQIAGPAFIKWGQWASVRRDLFPPDICKELSILQSGVPPHGFAHTKRVLEAAFGHPMGDLFSHFEPTPCASGSIAQVHKATLSEEGARRIGFERGKTVAVKVRHPDVETQMGRDFEVMLGVADFLSRHTNATLLGESVRQFRGPLMEQLDFSREAEHLKRFIGNFAREKHVSFPEPLYPYVSTDVLVETFEDGQMISNHLEGDNPWNRKLAHMGCETLFKMLLVDNFIHADLHPGNILLSLKEPTLLSKMKASFLGQESADPRPHITLLDSGMIASVKDQPALFDFFQGIATLDGEQIARSTLRLSRGGLSGKGREAFVGEVRDLYDGFAVYLKENNDLPPSDQCMLQLLDVVRRHKVRVNTELSVVMATVFTLEGWAKKLDPDLKVLKTIKEFTLAEAHSNDLLLGV